MKKLLSAILIVLCAATGLRAQNLKKMTFTPQWTPQAQFAGFYVAKEKGFFLEEGLDVEIKHIGQNSRENATDLLLSGEADIAGQQLMQSIVARADGKPLVNVMQITQQTGLCCASLSPLGSIDDLDGKKVGRWRQGFSEICDMLEVRSGIKTEWIPFISGINLLVFGAVDAMLCYSYSELLALEMAIGDIPEENIIRFSELLPDIPEDGLYVTDSYYSRNKDSVDSFVKAVKRGWEYAAANMDEALSITKKYIAEGNVLTNDTVQRRMLEEYLRLQIDSATGKADFPPVSPDAFRICNESLLDSGHILQAVEYKDFVK